MDQVDCRASRASAWHSTVKNGKRDATYCTTAEHSNQPEGSACCFVSNPIGRHPQRIVLFTSVEVSISLSFSDLCLSLSADFSQESNKLCLSIQSCLYHSALAEINPILDLTCWCDPPVLAQRDALYSHI